MLCRSGKRICCAISCGVLLLLPPLSLRSGTAVYTGRKATSSTGSAGPPRQLLEKELKNLFTVRAVDGVVVVGDDGNNHDPIAYALFDLTGPETNQTVREAQTDNKGRFRINRVPAGTYEFKAGCNGFDIVAGTVIVSKKAPQGARIKIALPMGT